MSRMRAIRRRKSAAQTIGKLTRAMAMVASLKLQKLRPRTRAAQVYAQGLRDMMMALAPKVEPRNLNLRANRTALLVITSNRGLVGAYNGNVLRLAETFIQRQEARGAVVELHVWGRKGTANFRSHERFAQTADQLAEFPSMTDLEATAAYFDDCFRRGLVDAFAVAYTRFISTGVQHALLARLLPAPGTLVAAEDYGREHLANGDQPPRTPRYELSPRADELWDALLPITLRASLFECFLHSATSESAARRIVTLRATENADRVFKALTARHNRARQAQITNELMCIIGAAEALRTAR
jgi:F-type H+-transporting ATPase subunit gamma